MLTGRTQIIWLRHLLQRMNAEAEINKIDDDVPERVEELALLLFGQIGVFQIVFIERIIDGQCFVWCRIVRDQRLMDRFV